MPTITTSPVSLESAVTTAGIGGTVAIVGLEHTPGMVTDILPGSAYLSWDGNGPNIARFSDNDRPEWHVLTSTVNPPSGEPVVTGHRDAAIAAAGIGGVIYRGGLFYMVGDSYGAPTLTVLPTHRALDVDGQDSHPSNATFYVADDWAVAGVGRPAPFAIGTEVTFTPETSGGRTAGTVVTADPNTGPYRTIGVGDYRYAIAVPAGDGMGPITILRGEASNETVTLPAGGMYLPDAARAAGIGGIVQYRDAGDNGRYAVLTDGMFRQLSTGMENALSQLSGHPVWSVHLHAGDVPASTSAVERSHGLSVPEPQVVAFLPRTADDAHALLTTLRTFGDPSDELVTALRTLRVFLPGGKAEKLGTEHQRNADLCGQYERCVTPTLGWTPRPSLVGDPHYDARAEFVSELAAFEQREASTPPSVAVQLFAERYARGGIINQALIDHIETHLEDHKIPGANELLDALGMDEVEHDPEHDYVVYATVTRSITVTTRVVIGMRATDEDSAMESVDSDAIYNAIDDSEWTVVESGESLSHSLSTSSYDVDDWEIDEVEQND